MKKVHLEIIATNAESCIIADQNGATRLEVCTALQVGGLTPSLSLVEYAVEFTKCDVAALIRTREGSFHYSQTEIKIMCEDIRRIRDKGAKAVVVGALTSDGFIDFRAIEHFVKAARGMDVAFQRAFDVCQDGDESIGKLESLGICRLLSSGKKPTCVEGLENLKRYAELTTNMEIMPGSGLRSNNIAQVVSACFSSYHTSASEMRFENDASIMPASYVVANGEEVRALSHFLTDYVSKFN
ncbi:MAG: copper homeostasis protein CutC [Bacteroidota bacterium]|jgi:copper homeostasis protein